MMKFLGVGAGVLLLVLGAVFLVSRGAFEQGEGEVIVASDLAARLEAGEPVFVLDVREPQEHQAMSIKDSVLIPLGELEQRADEVPKDRSVVVYCRSGRRSAQAVSILRAHGVENVRNLEGGIAAWLAVRACDARKNVC